MINPLVYKINENDVDMIIPNLWLGNKKAAIDKIFLDNNNIKYVVNVTGDLPCPFNDINYLRIPIRDKSDYVCTNNKMAQEIDTALKFILNALQNNTGVLVHCKKGHHRSAGIVMAFLIKYLKMSYLHSMLYINSLRPGALTRKTCLNNRVYQFYVNLL